MLDCKNALAQAEGDFARAEKILKEMGLAAATKRSGRATNEGRVFALVQGQTAGLLEVSCETDFVARNQDFISFGESTLRHIVEKRLSSPTPELTELVTGIISRIKENITLRRFRIVPIEANELVVDYVHGEGSIGVLVKIRADRKELLADQRVTAFAFETALHVAAYNPMFLKREVVDPRYLTEQEEIFRKQTESLNKPANVLEGIVKGKINKHLSEISLYQQPFVKDDKQSVSQVMEKVAKEVGGKIEIVDYVYFRTGEELAS